jgi:GxxExxY protein
MMTIKPTNNADAITLTPKQLNKLHEGLGTDGESTVTANDLMRLIGEYIKLKKFKERAEEIKQKRHSKYTLPTVENESLLARLNKDMELINRIVNASIDVYAAFPFSGKEHHYQAALEAELNEMGELVQQEMARLLHYKKRNGENIQLPHDIRGREDLLLPRKKMILELKQTGKLCDKEFNQICRYMEERRQNSDWAEDTKGMLINFGDNELECWCLFYANPEGSFGKPSHLQTPRLTRVLLFKEERPPIETFVDTFESRINKE